jgi:hypothetical protein
VIILKKFRPAQLRFSNVSAGTAAVKKEPGSARHRQGLSADLARQWRLAWDICPKATEATPDKVRLASDQQPPVQIVIVPRLQRQAGERKETWFAPGSILTRVDQPFRNRGIKQRAAKMCV